MTCLGRTSFSAARRGRPRQPAGADRATRSRRRPQRSRNAARAMRQPGRTSLLAWILIAVPPSALWLGLGTDLETDQQLHADRDLLELRRLQPLAAAARPRRSRYVRRAPRSRGSRRSARVRPGSAAPAARPASARRRSPSRRPLPGACRSPRGRTGPARWGFCPIGNNSRVDIVLAPTWPPASWATSSSRATSWSTPSSSILRMSVALTTSFRVSWTSVLVRVLG